MAAANPESGRGQDYIANVKIVYCAHVKAIDSVDELISHGIVVVP